MVCIEHFSLLTFSAKHMFAWILTEMPLPYNLSNKHVNVFVQTSVGIVKTQIILSGDLLLLSNKSKVESRCTLAQSNEKIRFTCIICIISR